jgi:transposase
VADANYFKRPKANWQRRYEALRASYLDRLSAKVIADRFGYTPGYVHLLRHLFKTGKLDFSEPVPEGRANRQGVSSEVRAKIRSWREKSLSAGEIAQLLSEEDVELSVRTVERVLAEEGFSKLPRRTRLKIGLTAKGASVPEKSRVVTLNSVEARSLESDAAGAFLFAPFLAQLRIDELVREADLPGSKAIPAVSYVLSFLALKLLGNERYAHVGAHSFDAGLGLFAGLNTLPKCTALSTYSYSLDARHIHRLQAAFVKQATKLGLYEGNIVNLDFHTVPHHGDESVLEQHWAGARGKAMKGALTLFAQDAQSKLMLYTAADIRRVETDDQVLAFLRYWNKVRRGVKPIFVFDSRFTTYAKLSELNHAGVKFITLRRRGDRLIEGAEGLEDFQRIHIPHEKRKYPNPQVNDSTIALKGYEGEIRQVIVRGNGREKPSFLISNDFRIPVDLLVGNYARRWRVENGIAEAVKFFHLNALSSPILTKVHFDVVLTLMADTLYTMLARKLRGFEDCNAAKIHRHFVEGKGTISVKGTRLTVTFPRRAHNPILRNVPWQDLPEAHPGALKADLALRFC